MKKVVYLLIVSMMIGSTVYAGSNYSYRQQTQSSDYNYSFDKLNKKKSNSINYYSNTSTSTDSSEQQCSNVGAYGNGPPKGYGNRPPVPPYGSMTTNGSTSESSEGSN